MSSKENRQVRKTRTAILDAFRETVLTEQSFDDVRVGDVIRRADIGRSTFYLHFDDKVDMLRQSVSHVLEPVADTVNENCDTKRLAWVLDHFLENSRFARGLLNGPSSQEVVTVLANLVEKRLEPSWSSSHLTPTIPLQLAAAQAAESLLGIVRAWLDGP